MGLLSLPSFRLGFHLRNNSTVYHYFIIILSGAFLFAEVHRLSPPQLYSVTEQMILVAFGARKTEMAKAIFYSTLSCYRANFSSSPAQRTLFQTFALWLSLACRFFPVNTLSRKVLFGNWVLKCCSKSWISNWIREFYWGWGNTPSFPYWSFLAICNSHHYLFIFFKLCFMQKLAWITNAVSVLDG